MASDYDSLFERTSHFTYDLVAGIVPGFTLVCSGFFAWHWMANHAIGVSEVLSNLQPANTSSAFILFLALVLACYLLGMVCTGIARILKRIRRSFLKPLMKWLDGFKPYRWIRYNRFIRWLIERPLFELNESRIQARVNAIFRLSSQWTNAEWLSVQDDKALEYALKWATRRIAVGDGDGSLVTIYHYKSHLCRALVIVWALHGVAALVCMFLTGCWATQLEALACFAERCYSSGAWCAEPSDARCYLVAALILGFFTYKTWVYYNERYWLAIAMEFCLRKRENVNAYFNFTAPTDDISG